MPSSSPVTPLPRWDIFCRVIDNFGDIGVCWRLARELSLAHGKSVRLWVDDLSVFSCLEPRIHPTLPSQTLDGIECNLWEEGIPPSFSGAECVIEAFACNLPPVYLAGMAKHPQPPRWINLEYLSAERWVEDCHGLSSPHPQLGLVKTFFFPGFTTRTGGLPWGKKPKGAEKTFLLEQGITEYFSGVTTSLFAYETAPVKALLGAWISSPVPVRCLVTDGKAYKVVSDILGEKAFKTPLGSLELYPLPFLPQADYDQLLLACDLNLVRGEDSFVRAQWAAKPFLWQIYPQSQKEHLTKLDAFLSRYTTGMSQAAQSSCQTFHTVWNTPENAQSERAMALAWLAWLKTRAEQETHAKSWAAHYAKQPNLAENIVRQTCSPL